MGGLKNAKWFIWFLSCFCVTAKGEAKQALSWYEKELSDFDQLERDESVHVSSCLDEEEDLAEGNNIQTCQPFSTLEVIMIITACKKLSP